MVVLAEGDEETLNTVRRFRDAVMLRTTAGRAYSNLYYQHAHELISIMLTKPDIREEANKIMKDLLPVIEASLKGESMPIKSYTVHTINNLCDRIVMESSAELGEAIINMKIDLNSGTLLRELGISPAEY